MKLIAAPLVVSVGRLTRRSEPTQIPLLIVNRLRTPDIVHNRITKRPTVRRPDLPTVVELVIVVGVALRTRIERALSRTEIGSPVFCMTIDTTDSRSLVRLDHR